VPAGARACTPLPPKNLHGKEGVDGSSPSEGFEIKEIPANRLVLVSVQSVSGAVGPGVEHFVELSGCRGALAQRENGLFGCLGQ
jgi:hypothetical protein